MEKMNIICLFVGSLETSCYIVHRIGEKECMVIDPGGDAEKISAKIKENKLILKYIAITHSHFDHIEGLGDLKNLYSEAEIICHETCSKRMQSPQLNLGHMLGVTIKAPAGEWLVNDGDCISFTGVEFKTIFLPGHAPGHVVLYSEKDKTIFSGDTLFSGSLGRTDFEGCSFKDLVSGIKKKILTLPDDTVVYPGHGPDTTIGEEKKHNPFIKDML